MSIELKAGSGLSSDTEFAETLILNFPTYKTVRKKWLLLKTVYGNLL